MPDVTLRSDRFPEIIGKLIPSVEIALASAAQDVADEAANRAPVASGALKDSIHTERDEGAWKVIAGDENVFYGHMVEFGTSFAAAQPFLIPALEAESKSVEDAVAKALEDL